MAFRAFSWFMTAYEFWLGFKQAPQGAFAAEYLMMKKIPLKMEIHKSPEGMQGIIRYIVKMPYKLDIKIDLR
ncbi:hypothetical protein DOX71_21530 [Cronobacter sakazakii]|nr:hypothetical protein [Cronobacter sakazakii]